MERERTSRQDEERWARRRRQPGTLNRMVASNLGIPDDCLDPEYRYHLAKDVRGRIQALTTQDDYEIVTFSELEENARRHRAEFKLTRSAFTASTGDMVSIPVERDGTRGILLRKPKDFYEADYEEGCAVRQAMMEARVYGAELTNDVADTKLGKETLDEEHIYAPKENTLGSAAPRRRGRIPQRMK